MNVEGAFAVNLTIEEMAMIYACIEAIANTAPKDERGQDSANRLRKLAEYIKQQSIEAKPCN